MTYMYSEMQYKLSKTRDSPLESMGQIISSRCALSVFQNWIKIDKNSQDYVSKRMIFSEFSEYMHLR